jgi:maleate cis-trans isomerase
MTEFPDCVVDPVIPQQCYPVLPEFGFTLDEIADAIDAVVAAVAMLGEAGCSAIGMEGTPFAWAGCESDSAARSRVDAMTAAAGVPVAMAGTAIVDALRALDARRVALCPTYYPDDWRDAWCRFVAACGFDIVSCRTMADQGVTGPIVDADTFGWDTGPELIIASVERAVADAVSADAIVVTGAGCRTNRIIADLESLADRPVIGSDTATFWAVAGAAGLTLRAGSLGRLTQAPLP